MRYSHRKFVVSSFVEIPLGVTAKNEAANLPRLLASLRKSVAFAELHSEFRFSVTVVLNDTTDDSGEKVGDFKTMVTHGGLVEAQRAFVTANPSAPFVIFSDADLVIEEPVLLEISKALFASNELKVAYANKIPLRPSRESILAKALYLYNLNEGYQSRRNYLNGQFFGIKSWHIPRAIELTWEPTENNRFLNLEAGIRCDDIYLSRDLLQRFGPDSIRMIESAVHYRPPETFRGMYRKYERMVLERERLDRYFPHSRKVAAGHRRIFVPSLLKSRTLAEKIYYSIFVIALYLCKGLLFFERYYYIWLATENYQTWRPVLESKREIE